jgi:hypothetical protein
MKSNQIFDKLTVELFFYGKIKKNFNKIYLFMFNLQVFLE